MKKLLFIAVLTAIISGCTTSVNTPVPNSVAAVVVGLGYKCDKAELRRPGSDIDTTTIEEMINTAYGHTVLSIDGSNKYIGPNSELVQHYVLKDHNATVNNVKAALTCAMEKELAIVYFSCKAKQFSTDDPTETDGLDEALVLYDGLFLDNEIWSILNTAKGRVFLIFDTSYAASMFKSTLNESPTDSIANGFLPENTSNVNMVCWAACNEDEVVKERSIGSKMTNTFYFKENPWYSYDMIFNKMQKTLDGKQNIKKIVIGEDFSDRTIFR